MVALAFYRGEGLVTDRVIRWVTRSPCSHVELIDPLGHSISSSARDGGVRRAAIDLNNPKWEVVPVPWAPSDAIQTIEAHLGTKYDYAGLILSQLFALRRHSSHRWFCSEICAAALGMARPHQYAPGDLYREVIERNAIFYHGQIRAFGKPPEERSPTA